jgi:hypothetical protein
MKMLDMADLPVPAVQNPQVIASRNIGCADREMHGERRETLALPHRVPLWMGVVSRSEDPFLRLPEFYTDHLRCRFG